MAFLFFYGRDSLSFGPFSPTEMRTLAAAGTILPSDSVWQEGDGRKLVASRVKNLFAAAAVQAAAAETVAAADEPSAPEVALARPEPRAALLAERPQKPAAKPSQKRVTRIVGGVLLGQDGVSVRFFKKCNVCGAQEATRSSAVIRSGAMRVGFFCRPCRKARNVELFGI